MQRHFSKALILIFLCISFITSAQDISELSKVNIDALSDSQIEAYVKRAQDSGLTMEQLELLARQRGMASSQIIKLRQRVLKLQSNRGGEQGVRGNESRLRDNYDQVDEVSFFDDLVNVDTLASKGLPIFGAKIFESAINFESPSNIATPESYVLGPGDEVIIDIYGASEITYQQVISPDGKILISGVGPISLSGISVMAAKERVFNRLSSIYSGLRGSRPNTFMELSVGSIKTVSVNVVGNVKRPGTYAMSSFSTAFTALYQAGGPDESGSMRSIEIIRGGKKIATLDVYKYFFEGDVSNNPQLMDGDAVVVKTYVNRVAYAGEVKQPAIYEFIEGETFQDLIHFSGGSNANGYDQSVTIFRSSDLAKSLVTFKVDEEDVSLFDGDSIFIAPISIDYSNRIKVEGAVEQAGFYELQEGMTLLDVLKLVGIREDAYKKRANIIRLNNDLSFSNISFDVDAVLQEQENHEIQNEDLIKIPSILNVKERKTITILGEVNNEGEYPFVDGMTVEDLIAISGGLKASANTTSVEVARRVSKDSKEFRTAIIFNYSIAEDLGFENNSTFQLEPFDFVTVKASALFRTQKLVKVEGEVLYPGFYALETEEDKLTNLLERAGGLTQYAYPAGASLIRDLDPNAGKSEEERDLETTSTDEGDYYRRLQLEGLIARDSVTELGSELSRKESVGIQFEKALESPGSKFNLILQDGDVLSIPKQLQTVRIRGQVLYPTRVSYDKASSFKDYISLAGGFSDDARIKKSYIVYANGRAERTKRFLLFRSFPKVEPGADIFIPERPERRPLSAGEILGITTGLGSLSFLVIQIVNSLN